MIPISVHVDPEMILNWFLEFLELELEFLGILGIPPRNYYKSVAAFTFLNLI